jgi:hypothetical protein
MCLPPARFFAEICNVTSDTLRARYAEPQISVTSPVRSLVFTTSVLTRANVNAYMMFLLKKLFKELLPQKALKAYNKSKSQRS